MKSMKILPILALTGMLAVPSFSATKDDILQLLPPGTPIAIIDDNPGETISSLTALAGNDEKEGGRAIDELFTLIGLEKTPPGLDLNGPAALAMPQVPFPLLIVSVTDYDLFLESLRGTPAEGTPPPMSPAPGIDALSLGGKPVFMRQEGDLALLTPMALLIAQPAAGAGLGGSLQDAERAILKESGSFIRLDVAMLMTFAEPMIGPMLAGMEAKAASPEGSEQPGEPEGDEQNMKILKAEAELLLNGLRQVRSMSVGLAGDEQGSTLRSIWIPRPESGFASILRDVKGADGRKLLRHFDSDAFFAGVFSMQSSAFKEMVKGMTDFMFDTGVYSLTPEEREEWQSLVDASFEVAGERSAFTMGPSSTGGAMSLLAIAEVQDTEKVRTLMRDSLAITEKLVSSAPGMETTMKMEMAFESETHRGIPIDRMSFSISPPDTEEAAEFDAYMEKMFGGPRLNLWLAYHEGRMIASYYAPTSEELKKLIDRVLDGVEGDLVGSGSFREATATLPEKTSFFSYYSIPRMMEVFAGVAMSVLPGDTPPMTFGLEKQSGFGGAWYSTGDALETKTYMPRAEIENLQAMIGYFQALAAKKVPEDAAPQPQQ